VLIPFSEVQSYLRAPGASSVPLTSCGVPGASRLTATYPTHAEPITFPMVADQPVLVDFRNSLLSRESFERSDAGSSPVVRRGPRARALKGALLGTAKVSAENLARFRTYLPTEPAPLLLMIGAATRGIGTDVLYDDPTIKQIAFDIYPSGLTHFVADAHDIPLADHCVDGVCIQAVLEHVVDPARVVKEIERVLKPNGVVYAETPFMQQVHEGAYDFTRFTELGHRWLWRHFTAISRGPLGGPGLSLYWSARYFFRGLLRNRRAGDLVSIPFGVFALADHIMPTGHMIDGASGAFFLGRKSAAPIGLETLVSQYLGAQRAR
jgi:SAM-dependent methyltransferase